MKKTIASMIFVCAFLSLSIDAQMTKSSTLPTDLLDLPAPPSVIPAKKKSDEKTRSEEFYDEKNIPPDDAPIEDLLDYWKQKSEQFDEFRYNLKPSKATLERILEELREKPERVGDFIQILPPEPEAVAIVKKAYEKSSGIKIQNSYNSDSTVLRTWLRNNSDMFIDELSQSAETIKMGDRTLDNQEDLEALARVSWDRAKPIVDRFEADRSNVETYTLAKLVQYHHALREKNTSDAESCRNELKKLVEDKSLSHKARDLAMDALVLGGDFEGRTEWYISLLNDETLLELQENGFTGLTTLPRHSPTNREQWLSSMIRLIETGTPTEKSAAIRNLLLILGKKDKEVLKVLLPWLTDENWARESDDDERTQYVIALGTAEIPEAIPGLISIITGEEDESLREAAINAVSSYNAPQAIPALRNALLREENEDEFRDTIINALIKLKGFSTEEQVAALEAFSAYTVKLSSSEDWNDEDDTSVQIAVGKILSDNLEPDDDLVLRVIERLKVLQRTNPPVAAQISIFLQRWKNRLVDAEMLNAAKSGKADVSVILKLLARRDDLRKRVPAELSAMKMIDGLPRGLSAVISEDRNEIFNILKNGDPNTQISALAAARLIRLKIPVGDVAPFLSNPNKSLALAAERYLEAEDSLEARNLILAKYAGETRILGARKMFTPVENKSFGQLNEPLNALFQSVYSNNFFLPDESRLNGLEKSLRDEIKQNADLQAVFALLNNGDDRRSVVRLFKDKIVFTLYEDQTRYYDRELSPKEYEAFYRFLIDSKIDTYRHTSDLCFNCFDNGEFLMFGRGGGRRVYAPRSYSQDIPPMDRLFEFFDSFAKGDLKLHYKLAEKIDGLEVLLADEKFTARSIWKNGDDFRVLVEDNEKKNAIAAEIEDLEKAESTDATITREERYKRRAQRKKEALFKHFAWRKIENNKISDTEVAQPNAVNYLGNAVLENDYYATASEPDNFRRIANGFEFRTENRYGGKLIKVAPSNSQTVVKEGSYGNPVVSPDGKWLIAEKSVKENESWKLVRINLQNGDETPINAIPKADIVRAAAFINSQYKFLIVRTDIQYLNYKNNPNPKKPDFYLLDPNTGAVQLSKGEFMPVLQQTYRRLQPTAGNPSEFWAAISGDGKKYTEIGRYDEKTATFKPVLQLPNISLNSMNVWVDEAESKVYFIYNGHLLAVPLAKQTGD